MFAPSQINERPGFQIQVRAIGDLATRAAFDGMERARAANGAWPSLQQIAHIQFIDPADIPRFAPVGLMANVQLLCARQEVPVDEMAIPMVGVGAEPLEVRLSVAAGSGRADCSVVRFWGDIDAEPVRNHAERHYAVVVICRRTAPCVPARTAPEPCRGRCRLCDLCRFGGVARVGYGKSVVQQGGGSDHPGYRYLHLRCS